MDLGIKGKVALVGGASKGLGRASAERLAREGAKVALCARNDAALNKTAGEMAAATGAEVIAIAADLGDPAAAARVVQTTVERLGGLDILVCNTGGPPVIALDA